MTDSRMPILVPPNTHMSVSRFSPIMTIYYYRHNIYSCLLYNLHTGKRHDIIVKASLSSMVNPFSRVHVVDKCDDRDATSLSVKFLVLGLAGPTRVYPRLPGSSRRKGTLCCWSSIWHWCWPGCLAEHI